jgi:hypothetical protein
MLIAGHELEYRRLYDLERTWLNLMRRRWRTRSKGNQGSLSQRQSTSSLNPNRPSVCFFPEEAAPCDGPQHPTPETNRCGKT